MCLWFPFMWNSFSIFLDFHDLNTVGDYRVVGASLVAQLVKNPLAMQETWVQSLGWEDLLEKGKLLTPVFWPKFHGLCRPWGCKEWDTTERLSLSHFRCIIVI